MKEPTEIKATLEQTFPDAIVEVEDTTGTKDHFRVTVASDVFKDKSLVESHKMVYAPFHEEIGGTIHAFSIKTYTREEYSAHQDNQVQ